MFCCQNYLPIKSLDCRCPSIISMCNRLWLVNQLNEFVYFLWELWQVLKELPQQNYINPIYKFGHLCRHPCSRLNLCVIWWKCILLCCLAQEFYLNLVSLVEPEIHALALLLRVFWRDSWRRLRQWKASLNLLCQMKSIKRPLISIFY